MTVFFDEQTFDVSSLVDGSVNKILNSPKRDINGLNGLNWWIECSRLSAGETGEPVFRVLLRVSDVPVDATVNYTIQNSTINGTVNFKFTKVSQRHSVLYCPFSKLPKNIVITCKTSFKTTTAEPTVKKSRPTIVNDVESVVLHPDDFENPDSAYKTPRRTVNCANPFEWWIDVYPTGNNPKIPQTSMIMFLRVSQVPVDVSAVYTVEGTNIQVNVNHKYNRVNAQACCLTKTHSMLLKAGVSEIVVTCKAKFTIPNEPSTSLKMTNSEISIKSAASSKSVVSDDLSASEVPTEQVETESTVAPLSPPLSEGRLDYSVLTPNDLILDSPNFLVGIPISTKCIETCSNGTVYSSREYLFPKTTDFSWQFHCYPCGVSEEFKEFISVLVEFRTMSFGKANVSGKFALSDGSHEKKFQLTFQSSTWWGLENFIAHSDLEKLGFYENGGLNITFYATVEPQISSIPELPSQFYDTPCDGAFVVGTERVPVHSDLLSYISPIFEQRFIENPYDTDVICYDSDPLTVSTVVDLLYGRHVTESLMLHIYPRMVYFTIISEISMLQDYLEQWILSKLTISNFNKIAEFAWTIPSKTLQKACGRFFHANMSMVTLDPGLLKLDGAIIKGIISMAQQNCQWYTSPSSIVPGLIRVDKRGE